MLSLKIDENLEKKHLGKHSGFACPGRLFDDETRLALLSKDKSDLYGGWMLCDKFERLIRYRFSDIPEKIKYLNGTGLPQPTGLGNLSLLLSSPSSHGIEFRDKFTHARSLLLVSEIEINRNESDNNSFSVGFQFSKSDSQWTGLFTPIDFLSEFERQVQEIGKVKNNEEYLTVYLPVQDASEVMETYVIQCINLLKRFQQKAYDQLLETAKAGSLVRTFNLPSELAVPCEQYLLYFTRFLRDLGIESTAEIEHRASDVLFSVRPTDKTVALETIREALDVYLRLAASPVQSTSLVVHTEIAVQRYEAELLTLHGRVKMAMAEIQMKDATIQAKDATIQARETELELLRRVLSSPSLSWQPVQPEPLKPESLPACDKEHEEVLGGIVALKPLKFPGGQLNVPEAFRRLRDLFSKPKSE